MFGWETYFYKLGSSTDAIFWGQGCNKFAIANRGRKVVNWSCKLKTREHVPQAGELLSKIKGKNYEISCNDSAITLRSTFRISGFCRFSLASGRTTQVLGYQKSQVTYRK